MLLISNTALLLLSERPLVAFIEESKPFVRKPWRKGTPFRPSSVFRLPGTFHGGLLVEKSPRSDA